MSITSALRTAIKLADAAKGGAVTSISDVEYDDIAIALAEMRDGPGEALATAQAVAEHYRKLAQGLRQMQRDDAEEAALARHDAARLMQAEERVKQLEAQLATVPVSTDDTRDARRWRYFREEHPRQIAAALNCSEYEIDDTMKEILNDH